jgi:hypothetical protein
VIYLSTQINDVGISIVERKYNAIAGINFLYGNVVQMLKQQNVSCSSISFKYLFMSHYYTDSDSRNVKRLKQRAKLNLKHKNIKYGQLVDF